MKIVLAVCGSISAYRCLDLTRELTKAGHEVKVILTAGAKKFVVPQVFKYLGAAEVYAHDDDFSYPFTGSASDQSVLHVELCNWADRFIIAPLSANSLARIAHGMASDLMSSVFLAWHSDKPVVIFPAMNTHMLNHPFTQEHLELIGKLDRLENIFIHPTAEGLLACGDEGAGKLASVEKMFSVITSYPNKRINKRVLITTGASEAPLDPVRFVTNPSSGTTGYELAKTALQRGYDVTVLAGNSATSKLELLDHLPGYSLIRLRTTEDFLDAVEKLLPEHDTYISSAALSDLSFETASGKLKKNELGSTLNVGKAPDVLKYALENKTKQTIVGFAAETDLSTSVISEKYKRKPTDFLIGTRVHSGDDENETAGFKTDQANYVLYKKDQLIEQGSLTKTQMASWLFDQLEASVD